MTNKKFNKNKNRFNLSTVGKIVEMSGTETFWLQGDFMLTRSLILASLHTQQPEANSV